MKKEDILKVFADNGIEIAEDKQSAVLGELNRLSGIDVTSAKKDYETLTAELEKYKKGDYVEKAELDKAKANQVDIAELEELRKFKKDTETKQTESVRKENILKTLDGKFDKKAVDLIYLVAKDMAEFNEDNSVANTDKLIKDLEEKYQDFTVKEEVVGAIPAVVNNAKVEKQPDNLVDALKDFYDKEKK